MPPSGQMLCLHATFQYLNILATSCGLGHPQLSGEHSELVAADATLHRCLTRRLTEGGWLSCIFKIQNTTNIGFAQVILHEL